MKLGTFSGVCDICGKSRGKGSNHDRCSKLRMKQGCERRLSEQERLNHGKWVQKNYQSDHFKPPE